MCALPRLTAAWLIGVTLSCITSSAHAGPLDPPPGTVAPAYKTLDQVRPGTPIESVPYIISAPGVYFFTGNLDYAGKAPDPAIRIEAPNVTLDLSGFTLTGPGPESGVPGVLNADAPNFHLRNGTITGFDTGVNSTARATHISSLTVSNCGTGISAAASHIIDCSATENTRVGITTLTATFTIPGDAAAASGSTIIERCSATANAQGGFDLAPGTQISDSTASINKRFGISTAEGCRINRCTIIGTLDDTAASLPGYGISLGSGSDASDSTVRNCKSGGIFLASSRNSVRNCTVSANGPFGIGGPGIGLAIANGYYAEISGCHVSGHTVQPGYGIAVVGDCAITNNTLVNNLEAGIATGGGGSRIVGNMARGNGNNNSGFNFSGQIVVYSDRNHIESNTCNSGPRSGIVAFGGRNVIVRNTCAFNPNANYVIAGAGNIVGPIIDRVASGGSITTSDASSNISY